MTANPAKARPKFDGTKIRGFFTQEVSGILAVHNQFRTLVEKHNPEDGRHVEILIRQCLGRFLPNGLEVFSGFILKPAVKKDPSENRGTTGQERRGMIDDESTQLDIIVYDSARYPVFLRFGDAAVVPPEGVVAVISVKKTLQYGGGKDKKTGKEKPRSITKECQSLLNVSRLCRDDAPNRDNAIRGPFLALVNTTCAVPIDTAIGYITDAYNSAQICLDGVISNEQPYFDDVVGYVGSIGYYEGSSHSWGIFKSNPNRGPFGKNLEVKPKVGDVQEAKLLPFRYEEGDEHLGLQFLLTGILSIYYDRLGSDIDRPGFTAFPSKSGEPLIVHCKALR